MSSYFAHSDPSRSYSPAAAVNHPYDDGYSIPISEPLASFDWTAANSAPPAYESSGGYPAKMESADGYALREWSRQNIIKLEKDKREKELMTQIVREADEYKVGFHKKWLISCDAKKVANREKEKVFVTNLNKLHAEANKDYWKSILELIPEEASISKGKVKKDQDKDKEKNPATFVIKGPKPGYPTDLTRMRQIFVNLNHNTPLHLKLSPPPAPDAKPNASVKPVAVA